MTDVVIIIILALILGGAIFCINKERSNGVNCIGCPDAQACAMRKNGQTCKGKDAGM